MARSIFGGELAHVAVAEDTTNMGTTVPAKAALALTKSVSVQFLNAPAGTVVTDYLTKDGTGNFTVPATSIPVDANGLLPEFQGPDGTTVLYSSIVSAGGTSYPALLARPVPVAATTTTAAATTAADVSVDTSRNLAGPSVQTALQDLYDRLAATQSGAGGVFN